MTVIHNDLQPFLAMNTPMTQLISGHGTGEGTEANEVTEGRQRAPDRRAMERVPCLVFETRCVTNRRRRHRI